MPMDQGKSLEKFDALKIFFEFSIDIHLQHSPIQLLLGIPISYSGLPFCFFFFPSSPLLSFLYLLFFSITS